MVNASLTPHSINSSLKTTQASDFKLDFFVFHSNTPLTSSLWGDTLRKASWECERGSPCLAFERQGLAVNLSQGCDDAEA